MLPVCPGWMPTPTAGLLNRPLMTLIFVFTGSSGARVLLELHLGARALGPPVVAVDAVAHEQHREPLGEGGRPGPSRRRPRSPRPRPAATPARAGPWSRPRRAGTRGGRCRSVTWQMAARNSHSAHGSHLVGEALAAALGQELGTGDDALDQGVEAVAVARQPGLHLLHRGRRRTASGCAPAHRPAACGDRLSRKSFCRCWRMYWRSPARPCPRCRRGSGRAASTGRPAEILAAPLADRPVALEHQPEGIEPRVAAGAAGIRRGAGPAPRAAAGPAWPRRRATPAPPPAAAGCARPARSCTTQ